MYLCQKKFVLQKDTATGFWEGAMNCKFAYAEKYCVVGSWQDKNNRLKCFSVYDAEKKKNNCM